MLRPGESLTAYETWCQIETLFHDHVNAKYLQLKLSFNQVSKDNRSMVDYLNYVKTISDSLSSISHAIAESDFILQILVGLPSEYSDVVTVMSARNPLPTFLELRSFLLAHESRIQETRSNSSVDQSQAFIVSRGRGFSNRGGWRGNTSRGGRQGGWRNNYSGGRNSTSGSNYRPFFHSGGRGNFGFYSRGRHPFSTFPPRQPWPNGSQISYGSLHPYSANSILGEAPV